MREILFRAKTASIDNPEWVEGYYAFDWAHWIDCKTAKYPERLWEKITPETLGEFTGIKDKNGVKIFEGDIVKHYNIIDDYDIGRIYWNNKTSSFRRTSLWLNSQSLPLDYSLDVNCEYEVIGNIYDNPELLEENK